MSGLVGEGVLPYVPQEFLEEFFLAGVQTMSIVAMEGKEAADLGLRTHIAICLNIYRVWGERGWVTQLAVADFTAKYGSMIVRPGFQKELFQEMGCPDPQQG